MNKRLANVEADVGTLKSDVNTLNSDVKEIKENMATADHLDAVAKTFAETFVQKTADHERRITNLEKHTGLTSS